MLGRLRDDLCDDRIKKKNHRDTKHEISKKIKCLNYVQWHMSGIVG